MPTEHSSICGGSSAGLRLKCPGSLKESKKVPSEPWNEAAAKGTALHTVTETAIDQWLDDAAILKRFVGEELESVRVTKDMITNKVFPALEFYEKQIPDDADVWLERRVGYDGVIDGAFGTSDVIFAHKRSKRYGQLDWKFGDNYIVNASDNDQGRFYLGAAIHSGVLPKAPSYEFWIFQPSVKLSPNQYASVGYYAYDELMYFVDELADAIEDALSDNPTYMPGEHCRYCKGRIRCKAFKDMLQGISVSDIPGMTGDDLSVWKKRIPALKEFIKDIDSAALRNALRGINIPGFALEPSQGNREWRDEAAASAALGRKGLSAKDRVETKLLSPAKVESLLKELGLANDDIREFMKRHTKRADRGERLAEIKGAEAGSGDEVAQLGDALGRI